MSLLNLMTQLKFSHEDLSANREGKLSAAQIQKYDEAPQFSPLVIAVILGHVAVIGGVLGILAITTGKTALWIVFGIVVALGLLPFTLLRTEGNFKPLLRSDVKQGRVKKTCGLALLEAKQGRQAYYHLTISGVTMQISSKQAAAFQHGENYCAYYLPNSQTFLTAEPFIN